MSNQDVLIGGNGPTTIDSDTRYKLAEAVIENLWPCSLLPKNFDTFQAPNKDLLNHGFPSRPDKSEKPSQFAKWNRFMSKPTQYITPTFEIITDSRTSHP